MNEKFYKIMHPYTPQEKEAKLRAEEAAKRAAAEQEAKQTTPDVAAPEPKLEEAPKAGAAKKKGAAPADSERR
jgi:hypothetical protein